MNSILKERIDIAGFSFPFEGERHLCTIVEIPYRDDTWHKNATPALEEFRNVVKAISKYEPVVVIIDPRIDYKTVSMFVFENTHVLRLPYNDSWARDNLPVFLTNKEEGRICGVDFGFNSWGGDFDGLYKPWDKDNELGKYTLLDLMIERHASKDFILEGGSVHSDGEGTLLVTEECLLSKGRNPNLSKEEIEDRLKKELGIEKVLWLPYGIYEDETNGHIDNVCCFLKPGTVFLAYCEDENDPEYERSKKNLEYLESVTDSKGRKLEIIKAPLPRPYLSLTKEEADGIKADGNAIQRKEGRRLSASYVNFYMGDKFLLLPSFGIEEDEVAKNILEDFYKSEKEIIQIKSREILLGGGNIHCITKQVPYMDGYPFRPEDKDI